VTEPSERPAANAATVEQVVRQRLSEAFGGVRGIIEAAVPTITFTVCYLATRELRLSLVIASALTAVLLIIRVVQRSNPQFVINALVGIGIAALFASRSGEARDVFLPGIVYNAGYAVVLVATVVIGWPAIGVMIGGLVGDLTSWRRDPGMRRLCNRLTLLFALPCVLRVVVQYPLYAADQIGWLGTSKIVMGWPLQIATLAAMVWLLSRNSTPATELEGPDAAEPG
jgi:MFS family permease